MSLLDTERATYETVWSSVEGYAQHSPGEQYLPLFQHIAQPRARVLDAGCGSGKGAVALAKAGFHVEMMDFTDAGLVPESQGIYFYSGCLWENLTDVVNTEPDWVYCTDVLEHIPPQFTMLAIDQMLRVAKEGLFLTVSLVPDNFGVWAGKSLHQTVQPFTWWKDSLKELGAVVEARDLISNAVFVVKR
jgi:ubiquinone/menaquinone biosynthesis C-methylase UbiE